jgi:L-threonylcarbamoyladenylate synthase
MTTNPAFQTQIRPYGTAALADAVACIARGECVAVPTETVYGLAADATNGAAVAGIYAAKGRPSFNPLIVHVADLDQAEKIAHFSDVARALAKQYWPGPLTLVLPIRPDAGIASTGIASIVTAGLRTIALRVPAHPVMQELLRACARPLAAPSANASGTISPTRAAHVALSLKGRIPLILDGGATMLGLESTIVAVSESGDLRLLRPGPIDLGLRVAFGENIEAPGQMASHYAPAKPLRLNVLAADPDEWMIGFGPIGGDDTLSANSDLVEAASLLFDALHRADASAQPRIAIAPIPATGIGVAINDRLARAAT